MPKKTGENQTQYNLKLPGALLARLQAQAAREGVSTSEWIRYLVRAAADRNDDLRSRSQSSTMAQEQGGGN